MKKINFKEKGSFIIPTVIISLIVILIGAFIFISIKNRNDENQTPAQILSQINDYKAKLAAENAKLGDLEQKLNLQNKISLILDGYSKATSIINETDILFANASTNKPELKLKIKNTKIESEINAQRLLITKILDSWKNQIINRSIVFSQSTIDQFKKDISTIQAYIKELQGAVQSLNTTDSGLTQAEIDNYQKLLENKAEEIDKVVNTIPEIENNLGPIDTPSNDNNPPSNNPPVTVEDVQAQKDAVAKIEEQINNLEADLQAKQAEQTTPQNVDQGAPNLLQNWTPIQYQQNPAPYKDTGVDTVSSSGKPSLLQGW